ncbi:MAG TPA: PqqD family peptide modification chaperone [Thermoanaerobaculia bacterium]|jgi:O-methyltransferase
MEKTAFPLQEVDVRTDGEDAVFSVRAGSSYRVNAVGRAICEQLREPVPLTELRRRVAAEFDVPPDECTAAVDAFIEQLQRLELVDVIEEEPHAAAIRRRYLDLLKRALVNLIYPEHELRIEHLEQHGAPADLYAHQRAMRDIRYDEAGQFEDLVRTKTHGLVRHRQPTRYSHTMIGLRRLENLHYCAASVFANGVAGDFLEAGVCQGGAAIFLRALQVAYGQEQRKTWVADSFCGLPLPTEEIDVKYEMDLSEPLYPWLAISRRAVEDNFRTYDLLSDNVRFLEGWFSDTLPSAPIGELAILRIDGDLYESTRDVLTALYDRLSPGGFVIIDDYGAFAACRAAVDEFREQRGITATARWIDWTSIYWQKAR